MKVVRADHAGACYGVQRALDMAREAAGGELPAYTLGPLIHNPAVVAQLESEGVHIAYDAAELSGARAIIRSHGVTPEALEEVSAIAADVVDATCPHVARAQRAAAELAREGCHVIVVGEPDHPEVEGLMAYARKEGAQVDAVPSAQALPAGLKAPVGVVVQTTQRAQVLDEVLDAIRTQGIEPQVQRTICTATSKRQNAAEALAGQVDAIVVLGGRNSSNTTRLAEICAATGTPTYHIESDGELDPAWFEGCTSVGLTAGASTPEDQIAAVSAVLERL